MTLVVIISLPETIFVVCKDVCKSPFFDSFWTIAVEVVDFVVVIVVDWLSHGRSVLFDYHYFLSASVASVLLDENCFVIIVHLLSLKPPNCNELSKEIS